MHASSSNKTTSFICDQTVFNRFQEDIYPTQRLKGLDEKIFDAALRKREDIRELIGRGDRMKLRLLGCIVVFASQAVAQPLIDKVRIHKSARTLSLIVKDKVIKTYYVSIGFSPRGHKVCEGDGRTPEGTYYIEGRNMESPYHRSLRISYPNSRDVEQAQNQGLNPGGDIMIHGLPPELTYLGKSHVTHMWTRGCVAVTNQEIEEICSLVDDGTPVEILP